MLHHRVAILIPGEMRVAPDAGATRKSKRRDSVTYEKENIIF